MMKTFKEVIHDMDMTYKPSISLQALEHKLIRANSDLLQENFKFSQSFKALLEMFLHESPTSDTAHDILENDIQGKWIIEGENGGSIKELSRLPNTLNPIVLTEPDTNLDKALGVYFVSMVSDSSSSRKKQNLPVSIINAPRYLFI